MAGIEFEECRDERPDPVEEAELAGAVYSGAMRRARDSVVEYNKWARANRKEPERCMCYTVTLHCTHSEFLEIKDFIERYSFKKWFRQEELPVGSRQGG